MNFRTDLAIERHESVKDESLRGVTLEKKEINGIKISHITVTDEEGEKNLGKKMGRYITAELPDSESTSDMLDEWSEILSEEIKKLLRE